MSQKLQLLFVERDRTMTAFVIHRGMEISDPVFCSLGEVGMHFTLLSHYCDAEYRGKTAEISISPTD